MTTPNPNYAPDFRGWLALKKTSGLSTNPSIGTVYQMPAAEVQAVNPDNLVAPAVVNATSFPSVDAAGKKTPQFLFRTYAKATWFSAVLLNSFVNNLNSTNGTYQTDGYAAALNNVFETLVYDVSRCQYVQISQAAASAPVLLESMWRSVYGDSEAPTPTDFTEPSTADGGQLVNVSQVGWTGFDEVQAFTLTLMRPQAWVLYDDGTFYAVDIASGGFGGTLQVVQSPTFNETAGGGANNQSGSGVVSVGSTGAGVEFSMLLRRSQIVRPLRTTFGQMITSYDMRDVGQVSGTGGGNPCSMTAM